MEAKEIQERNKQIALMLVLKPLTSPYLGAYQPTRDTHNPKFYHERMEGESWYVYPNYDSDWNWLMEAVEFIEKLNYNINIFHQDSLIEKDNKFIVVTHAIKNKTKKESVFIAVSDFAKKFNNKEL
jgi:hypothetical protein